MTHIEISEQNFELLGKIGEYFSSRYAKGQGPEYETPDQVITGLIGALSAHNDGVNRIVFPDDFCQICGKKLKSADIPRRACEKCFNQEMKEIGP